MSIFDNPKGTPVPCPYCATTNGFHAADCRNSPAPALAPEPRTPRDILADIQRLVGEYYDATGVHLTRIMPQWERLSARRAVLAMLLVEGEANS